jgi:hypothetical protein
MARIWIEAGQQREPRRHANGVVVKMREAQSFACQSVDVRRLNLAAEAGEVAIADIVGHDQHNVRPGRFGGRAERYAYDEASQQSRGGKPGTTNAVHSSILSQRCVSGILMSCCTGFDDSLGSSISVAYS